MTTAGSPGGIQYTVMQGDCIESIAFAHGHHWETLWNHPGNRELVAGRGNPNILLPGDSVFVPGIVPRSQAITTGQVHPFRVKGVPFSLNIQLLDEEGRPRENQEYTLSIDGAPSEAGSTLSGGWIRRSLPPGSRQGRLVVRQGMIEEHYSLRVGHLDPYDSLSGLRQRLTSLGFHCDTSAREMDESTWRALRAFTTRYSPGVDDPEDPFTLVRQVYGC